MVNLKIKRKDISNAFYITSWVFIFLIFGLFIESYIGKGGAFLLAIIGFYYGKSKIKVKEKS